MFAYWFMFAFFTAGVVFSSRSAPAPQSQPRLVLALGALMIMVLVGLRYEVGGDWEPYLRMFSFAGYADFGRMLRFGDPGYHLINWSVRQAGGEIWVVNLICAMIFAWGLFRFAKVQPDPWLTMLIAIPYLVVVVAMGYTRQAVSIGFLMAGLAALARGGTVLRFSAYIFAAALFHKTAVVALLLVAFASQRNRLLNTIALIGAFILFYDLFLSESLDTFVKGYIDTEYSSQGAAIRVAMSVLPAAIFLVTPKRFGFPPREEQIWRNFSIATLVLLGLLFVLPSSTVVDRLALYMIPLQLAILSRVPRTLIGEAPGKILIVSYCFAVQFAWLNYASHSQYWVPYQLQV